MWRDAGLARLSGNALLLGEALLPGPERGSLNSLGLAESHGNEGHLLWAFHPVTARFGVEEYKSRFISALRCLCLVYFFPPSGEKRIVFRFFLCCISGLSPLLFFSFQRRPLSHPSLRRVLKFGWDGWERCTNTLTHIKTVKRHFIFSIPLSHNCLRNIVTSLRGRLEMIMDR